MVTFKVFINRRSASELAWLCGVQERTSDASIFRPFAQGVAVDMTDVGKAVGAAVAELVSVYAVVD